MIIMAPRVPSLVDIEKRIGVGAYAWKARCYEISRLLVDKEIIKGTVVYGHWLGPIASTSFFSKYSKIGFVHHGWVITKDRWVIDPTRWVFEDVRPYVYIGHPEQEDRGSKWPYDEGGNNLRWARLTPPPEFTPNIRRVDLGLYTDLMRLAITASTFLKNDLDKAREYAEPIVSIASACAKIHMLFNDRLNGHDPDSLTIDQVFWLANVPYQALEPSARVIYRALARAGQKSLIPVDNWLRAER